MINLKYAFICFKKYWSIKLSTLYSEFFWIHNSCTNFALKSHFLIFFPQKNSPNSKHNKRNHYSSSGKKWETTFILARNKKPKHNLPQLGLGLRMAKNKYFANRFNIKKFKCNYFKMWTIVHLKTKASNHQLGAHETQLLTISHHHWP